MRGHQLVSFLFYVTYCRYAKFSLKPLNLEATSEFQDFQRSSVKLISPRNAKRLNINDATYIGVFVKKL